ncbi:RxLR-like protein [Plasmopara halstedii]|uniref:RxLR-like protein n=1 Tax=Plasmopara halstedii TaxID=4781 RepID=A0A0P1ABT9_PLAHL|nr:RxLR-like protein [Plasmopara halstedii]CEG38048.1 RxLR-like protein [Plasmopara halstedii]|eukprot:XP_024574417.1 RxLR-like protein [Plasmopara halstedii]
MDTYMFVLLVLVALLSVVAATNDTLSVQSVPSPALKNSSVTTKAVNGAMPVNVNDENRMSREFWHPREFNPQQTYDKIVKSLKQDELLLLKPELKKLANEMHKHNQRHDPEKNAYLQLTQMVIKSHGEGGLSRMIGVQKLSKHAMTDETIHRSHLILK